MTDQTSLPDSVKQDTVQVEASTASEAGQPVDGAAPQDGTQPSEPGTVTGNQSDQQQPQTRENDRIRTLVEQKNAEKAKRAEAERQAAYYRQQLEAIQPNPAGDETSYDGQGEYLKAVMAETMADFKRTTLQEQAQQAEAQAIALRDQAFQGRVNEFAEKAPDYHQVVTNPNLQITPLMADAIKESETGAAIAYYLGKNPQEAARIASMSPLQQATAIGRLEEKVALPQQRQTQAPPPVKTVSGGVGAATPDLASGSFEDFKRIRMAGKA